MKNSVDEKRYHGNVQAIILDWSGTTADAYVVAPAIVFVEVFKRQNVEISMAEARSLMGLRKDLHIKALTEVNEIKERWKNVHGKYPDQIDERNEKTKKILHNAGAYYIIDSIADLEPVIEDVN